MKRLHTLIQLSLLLLVFVLPSSAGDWIVRLKSPSQSGALVQQVGAPSVNTIHNGQGLYKVTLPAGPWENLLVQFLKMNPAVQNVEPDQLLGLPRTGAYQPPPSKTKVVAACGSSCPSYASDYLVYTGQPSNSQVQITTQYGTGAGVTVAVIDTGVDGTHPVLSHSMAGAVDLTGNNDLNGTLAQETSPMVDQETSPMVDQETSPMVDAKGTIILNQETSPMVDGLGVAFGHATMVAGIIHLVVPSAKFLSIKSFTNDGMGATSAIVQGIYYAVEHGAQVINASWSTVSSSDELKKAIQFAHDSNVIVVAAVANNGTAETVYPAAYGSVIGVACVEASGLRCSFSDFGNDVAIAAPGDGITSTFPIYAGGSKTPVSNGFARGTGTSFSTPYVTGAAALIRAMKSLTPEQAAADIAAGHQPVLSYGLGAGQLSVSGAGKAAQ